MPRMVSLRQRFAELIPELAKFGVVGLIGSVIDLGGAAYLHNAVGMEALAAKALSITAATVVTYLGSRFWTFRHRVNQDLLREGTLFLALNIVGLAIAECVIALVTYGFDMKGTLAYNAASVVGTGLGTIFRYFSYKKWVFLAGAPGAAVAAGEAAVSGIVDAADTAEEAALRTGAIDGNQAVHHHDHRDHRGHRYEPLHSRTSEAWPGHGYEPSHSESRSQSHGQLRGQSHGLEGYEPSQERSEPAGEHGYGPPWEHLDPADAPRR
jgi:putative flippase GtrA